MPVAPGQKASKISHTGTVHFQCDNGGLSGSRGAPLKRRNLTKAKLHVAPNEKPLNVRYAELLRLRQAVINALSEKERTQADQRRPNWRRIISDHCRSCS